MLAQLETSVRLCRRWWHAGSMARWWAADGDGQKCSPAAALNLNSSHTICRLRNLPSRFKLQVHFNRATMHRFHLQRQESKSAAGAERESEERDCTCHGGREAVNGCRHSAAVQRNVCSPAGLSLRAIQRHIRQCSNALATPCHVQAGQAELPAVCISPPAAVAPPRMPSAPQAWRRAPLHTAGAEWAAQAAWAEGLLVVSMISAPPLHMCSLLTVAKVATYQ